MACACSAAVPPLFSPAHRDRGAVPEHETQQADAYAQLCSRTEERLPARLCPDSAQQQCTATETTTSGYIDDGCPDHAQAQGVFALDGP